MIIVNNVLGNIFHNKEFNEKFEYLKKKEKSEFLKISRIEAEKSRLKRKTDKGEDVGLVLSSSQKLRHGDVLFLNEEKIIIVNQIPEKVISIKLKDKTDNHLTETLVLLGHIIGNRHRPIQITKGGIVFFPISADSEIDVFKKLLSDIINQIDISVEEKIFEPHGGMNVHEH